MKLGDVITSVAWITVVAALITGNFFAEKIRGATREAVPEITVLTAITVMLLLTFASVPIPQHADIAPHVVCSLL